MPMKLKLNWLLGIAATCLLLGFGTGWLTGRERAYSGAEASGEVNAFITIRNRQLFSAKWLHEDNRVMTQLLKARARVDSTTNPILLRALGIRQAADDAVKELDRLYQLIVEQSGPADRRNNISGQPESANPNDHDAPSEVMIAQGNGKQLHTLLQNTREHFASVYCPDWQDNILETMMLQSIVVGDTNQDWVEVNFGNVPTVAALTTLASLQNDVRISERRVLEYLTSQVGIESIELDLIQAVTFPDRDGNSQELLICLTGSPVAVIPMMHIGALDRDKIGVDPNGELRKRVEELESPPMHAGYTTLPIPRESGVVRYQLPASKTYSGVIEVINPRTAETTYFPFEGIGN